MAPLVKDLAERFWSKVNKNGPIVRPELGPCWLFTGYRNKYGYGVIWNGRRTRMAHHIALELAGWILPFEWSQALHKCDNPPCVRPDHLRIGTAQDDADDMTAKGRRAVGERNGMAKLRGQGDADEIRRLYQEGGITQEALGQQFGVTQTTISRVLRSEAWR
jgi:hypothetical protein